MSASVVTLWVWRSCVIVTGVKGRLTTHVPQDSFFTHYVVFLEMTHPPCLIFHVFLTPARPERGGWIMQKHQFVFLYGHRLSHQGCRPGLHLCELTTSFRAPSNKPAQYLWVFYCIKKLIHKAICNPPRSTPQQRPMGWGRVVLLTWSSLRRALDGLWRCLMAIRSSQKRARSQSELLRAFGGYLMPTRSPASIYM